jgi:hypothetical protein
MEGVEIVITPRTLERVAYITVIAVLLVLVVLKWGDSCTDAGSNATAGVLLENTQNSSASAVEQAPVLESTDPCENGVQDDGETDVDCGGSCGGCPEFKTCNVDADCESELYCFQHIKCLKPTCEDGIKNQDETNVDCGGACEGFWWTSDKKCHDKTEPSGELDVAMSASVDRSPNSGNAIIKTVSLTVDNGLDRDLSLSIYLYARTPNGGIVFENQDGEIAISNVNLNVKTGLKESKTIDMSTSTRSILPSIKSTEEFQIVAVVRDSVRKTIIDEFTWTNS